jgi:hypothetical protein
MEWGTHVQLLAILKQDKDLLQANSNRLSKKASVIADQTTELRLWALLKQHEEEKALAEAESEDETI